MSSSYPSEVQRFIDHQLACGRFTSEREVVVAGLQLLVEMSDRFVDLKGHIARSVTQGERGQLSEVDFEALKHRLADKAGDSHI